MKESPRRVAIVALAFIGVLAAATFATQGTDGIYKGDAQSFRLVAEDPFGDGHRILADDDVGDQGVAYRYGRILFPLLGWAGAGGQPTLVSLTLPLIGIISFAASAYLAARLCRHAGASADRGFLVTAVPTMVTSAVLVYGEPLAIALLLAVHLCFVEDRRRLALGVAMLLPLAREAYLVGLVPLIVEEGRRRSWRHAGAVAVLVATPYVTWLTWVRWRVGEWSFRDPSQSRTDAIGLPGLSLREAIHDADGDPPVIIGAVVVALLGALGFVAALVLVRRMRTDRILVQTFVAFALLGLAVGPQGYRFPGDGLRVLLPGHLILALLAARNLSPKREESGSEFAVGDTRSTRV